MKPVTILITVISILTINHCLSQTNRLPLNQNTIDTSKIIAKVCTHGLPYQKRSDLVDYPPFVCAYIDEKNSFKSFNVLSYDFIDLNNEHPKEIHVSGNSLGSIKIYLIDQDSVTVKNLFLANIVLEVEGRKITLKGLRPILGPNR